MTERQMIVETAMFPFGCRSVDYDLHTRSKFENPYNPKRERRARRTSFADYSRVFSVATIELDLI